MSTADYTNDSPTDTNDNNTAAMESTPKRASLLGLPQELRDEIWTWALGTSESGVIDVRTRKVPAVLHTSRQIRYEASRIYYRQRVGVDLPSALKDWLRCFLPAVPADIARIQILTLRLSRANESRGWAERMLRALETAAWDLSVQDRVEIVVAVQGSQNRCLSLREVEEMGAVQVGEESTWGRMPSGGSCVRREHGDGLRWPCYFGDRRATKGVVV